MFLNTAWLILQMIDELTIWPRITIKMTHTKFMSTHAESFLGK